MALHRFKMKYSLVMVLVGSVGCTKTNFVATPTAALQTPVVQLRSTALSYAATVGIPLIIAKSDILAAVSAPAGDQLTLVSMSAPPSLDSLVDQGVAYSFTGAKAESISLQYQVTDTNSLATTNTITIKVLPNGAATASYYACGSGKLYELSADNQAILSTVNTTYNGQPIQFNDLAIDTNGLMYAKDQNHSGIYTVNVTTGVATQLAATVPNSSGYLEGLTLLPDGTLATAQLDGKVLSFNPTTLQTTVFKSTSYTMVGGDFKWLPGNFAYWTVANTTSTLCKNFKGNGNQTLVRVDLTSGSLTEVGCLDQPSIYGIGFAHGEVYGFTGSGNVVQIDTSTASTTVLASPNFEFWGAASNPALW